jgi:hypothetical protein
VGGYRLLVISGKTGSFGLPAIDEAIFDPPDSICIFKETQVMGNEQYSAASPPAKVTK